MFPLERFVSYEGISLFVGTTGSTVIDHRVHFSLAAWQQAIN